MLLITEEIKNDGWNYIQDNAIYKFDRAEDNCIAHKISKEKSGFSVEKTIIAKSCIFSENVKINIGTYETLDLAIEATK